MLPLNTDWMVVTVKQPVMFHQTADETWLLNPNRRYVFNANRLAAIEGYVATVSELEGASLYHRLTAGADLHDSKLLVERCRERGIGDLLFMTGPLGYLRFLSGGSLEVDMMAFSDRGVVLANNPLLHCGCVRCGALEYDHLRHYNYHWMVNSVTEQNCESDQDNVYDALFRQLGYDPEKISPDWKRPYVALVDEDFRNLDQFYRHVWHNLKLDLRHLGYYVVAPFSNATLRCMPYATWLETIKAMSQRKPVLVVGNSGLRLPDMDIGAGEFSQHVARMGGNVINAVDSTSLRVLMALIARSSGVVGLDSAPLYMAQAVGTPAVSIWGTHAPGSRIGYSDTLMRLAVWKQTACSHAPCFAYAEFPVNKCPEGAIQRICSVTAAVTVNDVMSRVDIMDEMNHKKQAVT